jgi:hypothetical protein
LEAANIPRIGIDGWEADDVIASLTTVRHTGRSGHRLPFPHRRQFGQCAGCCRYRSERCGETACRIR